MFQGEEGRRIATCGSNAYGQLGHGDLVSLSLLTVVRGLLGKDVFEVTTGVYHTLYRVQVIHPYPKLLSHVLVLSHHYIIVIVGW